jgi:hypothetical protein
MEAPFLYMGQHKFKEYIMATIPYLKHSLHNCSLQRHVKTMGKHTEGHGWRYDYVMIYLSMYCELSTTSSSPTNIYIF